MIELRVYASLYTHARLQPSWWRKTLLYFTCVPGHAQPWCVQHACLLPCDMVHIALQGFQTIDRFIVASQRTHSLAQSYSTCNPIVFFPVLFFNILSRLLTDRPKQGKAQTPSHECTYIHIHMRAWVRLCAHSLNWCALQLAKVKKVAVATNSFFEYKRLYFYTVCIAVDSVHHGGAHSYFISTFLYLNGLLFTSV